MRALHRVGLPALILVSLLVACQADSKPRTAARDAGQFGTPTLRERDTVGQPENPMLRQRGKVTLTTRDGRELQLDVEIASNDEERARGLMFRRTMPEMAGMYFVFAEETFHSFWMKNTFLPLDMIFIDASGRIAGIVEHAEPHTTTSRSVDAPSKDVLEVNAGWCARHGVRAGDRVRLQGMYDLR